MVGAQNQSEQECSGHASTLQTAADICSRGNSDTEGDGSACRTLSTHQAVGC